ncbi:transcriptional regulator [Klebsiella pneumoniae]|uniref:Transcriptional regulator n=1 Tax=Klebsiella pneumoniae TaxID=573 RepID=A0A377TRB3_KLEPN|nr:transcriptional regulator [Klebsiella pneumoniae]
MAGFAAEAECETVLQRITREQRTPYTVTDIASLMEKIAQVRRQGYATIEQEFEIGMLVLAVPLTDREGTWWGALSLTSHQSRTSLERYAAITSICSTARRRCWWVKQGSQWRCPKIDVA